MKPSNKKILVLLSFLFFSLAIQSAYAQAMKPKMVGGAEMYPTKNIIENAMNSKDHTTLVDAVKAARLVKTLEGKVIQRESILVPNYKLVPNYPYLITRTISYLITRTIATPIKS